MTVELPVRRIYCGVFGLLKRGRPTAKNPEGVTTEISFQWRAVKDEEGEPCVVAMGAHGGMQYAIKLPKGQMIRAVEEIERLEDQIRRERNGDF